MRVVLALLVLASGLLAVSPAHAWYDRWGRWHPDYRRYYPEHRDYGYVPPPGYYYYLPRRHTTRRCSIPRAAAYYGPMPLAPRYYPPY
jgi:hypothetical protein